MEMALAAAAAYPYVFRLYSNSISSFILYIFTPFPFHSPARQFSFKWDGRSTRNTNRIESHQHHIYDLRPNHQHQPSDISALQSKGWSREGVNEKGRESQRCKARGIWKLHRFISIVFMLMQIDLIGRWVFEMKLEWFIHSFIPFFPSFLSFACYNDIYKSLYDWMYRISVFFNKNLFKFPRMGDAGRWCWWWRRWRGRPNSSWECEMTEETWGGVHSVRMNASERKINEFCSKKCEKSSQCEEKLLVSTLFCLLWHSIPSPIHTFWC